MWYHYFDAHEVFNSIRCYIAAYVWMTGFGKEIRLRLESHLSFLIISSHHPKRNRQSGFHFSEREICLVAALDDWLQNLLPNSEPIKKEK